MQNFRSLHENIFQTGHTTATFFFTFNSVVMAVICYQYIFATQLILGNSFTPISANQAVLMISSIKVFTEFAEFNDKIYFFKRLFEPATSCIRDLDATTTPAGHS